MILMDLFKTSAKRMDNFRRHSTDGNGKFIAMEKGWLKVRFFVVLFFLFFSVSFSISETHGSYKMGNLFHATGLFSVGKKRDKFDVMCLKGNRSCKSAILFQLFFCISLLTLFIFISILKYSSFTSMRAWWLATKS